MEFLCASNCVPVAQVIAGKDVSCTLKSKSFSAPSLTRIDQTFRTSRARACSRASTVRECSTYDNAILRSSENEGSRLPWCRQSGSRGGRKLRSVTQLCTSLLQQEAPPEADSKAPLAHRRNILQIQKEAVILVNKPALVKGLADALDPGVAKEFRTLALRIDATIRAWYKSSFEDLMQLYLIFDPLNSAERIQQYQLKLEDVEKLEIKFLRMLFRLMEKSNYKLVTDKEYELAVEGSYLLSLPIQVDDGKLEGGLLKRYFERYPHPDAPSFSNKYLIFRRGVGLDQVTDRFLIQKVDMVLGSLWNEILVKLRLREPTSWEAVIHDTRSKPNVGPSSDTLSMERIHLEDMHLSLNFLLSRNTIQEPTFERIIILHRPATPPHSPSPLGDRTIFIKHFRHIPMADMEVVLPGKKTPGLTPRDWISMATTGVLGAVAVASAAKAGAGPDVFTAIIVACGSYIVKLYLAWKASMRTYRALIQQSMYDKQLDSGLGTLLHMFDDVLQQEFKEAIIAYFVLLTRGPASKEELDKLCETFMEERFQEKVEFDVEDAVDKLLRLGLAKEDANGHYINVPLEEATAALGPTMDERFGTRDLEDFENEDDINLDVADTSSSFSMLR